MAVITIMVKTNAPKEDIVYDKEKNIYKVSVKAIPDKGKANQAIIKLFKKKLDKNAEIISGFTSRKKMLRVS